MKDRHCCYSRRPNNMSPSPCGFQPTTGIRYNIAYKTSDRNPNIKLELILALAFGLSELKLQLNIILLSILSLPFGAAVAKAISGYCFTLSLA